VTAGTILLASLCAQTAHAAPGARACHAATNAPALGGLIVFGGALQCGRNVLPDDTLWLWNGATWTALAHGGPSAREDAQMTFDSRRNTLVLYGGRRDGAIYSDTWEWNRAAGWRRITSTTNPGALEHAAITFDSLRGRAVLFGGALGRTFQAATWEWDGRSWSKREAAVVPDARIAHSMTWSASLRSVVLYGGFSQTRQYTDLWRWNGTRWTRIDTAGPTYSEGPSLAAGRQGLLVAGPGVIDTGAIRVWRYADARWTPVAAASDGGAAPPTLIGAQLTYDSRRDVYVWSGGALPSVPRIRLVEFGGNRWRRADVMDTTDRLRRIVAAIAHDSMLGRPTPSPQLDQAAQFIAREFADAGLSPLGDDGGFLRRYPVVETILDEANARIEFGQSTTWRFGQDFFWAGGGGGDPSGELRGPAVLVSGSVTRENAASLGLEGKTVLFVPRLDARGSVADFGTVFALGGAGAKGVIVASGRPASLWDRLRQDHDELKPAVAAAWPTWTADTSRPRPPGWFAFRPFLQLWEGRFAAFAQRAGIDTAALRVDGPPTVTPLAFDAVMHFDRRVERVSWAPNVIELIKGTDPVLRSQYIVVTAHFDGLGRAKGAPPGPRSVLNGADDNASGVAAIIQAARALTSASVKPRRSVILVAVSGEERGLWGSDAFAMSPPVPSSSIVANVNLDMVGRAAGDSVFITGLGDPVIGGIAARALAASPRRLTVLREAELERRYPGQGLDEDRSDHANFRRRGIPSVHFFTGMHTDYHSTNDDADKLNYDTLQRISDAVARVVRALADAPAGTLIPRSRP
jgi:hypothetical protein